MAGGFALMYSLIREALGSGIERRMFSGLRSSHMIISMDKNGCRVRPTSVNIPAFAMKVVQSEKNLFCDAFRNGQGEPILPRLSKVC